MGHGFVFDFLQGDGWESDRAVAAIECRSVKGDLCHGSKATLFGGGGKLPWPVCPQRYRKRGLCMGALSPAYPARTEGTGAAADE